MTFRQRRFLILALWSIYALAAVAEQKPNFIVIITDDQGWDDIGLHNPQYVNTPNLDRFIQKSTFFDNFYVTPQCAQTRAALLTGRSYPRTGTVLVNGGFDMINSDEATAGRVMSQAGYTTLQYGKWHNKQVLGYEPWNVGFDFGQMDSAVAGLVSTNGTYEEVADHDGEGQRMAQLINYLTNWSTASRKAANKKAPKQPAAAAAAAPLKPFFVYYATPAIHVTRDRSEAHTVKKVRLYPAAYRSSYHDNPKYQGISNDTLDAWAMLEYFDVQLGRLLDSLQVTGLGSSTYVMIMSDNGAALMQSEDKTVRMPSGMVGNKSTVFEGGVRNFLAIQGPGVQPGVIDSTLLDVTDILPTVAELAGVNPNGVQHKSWDGISFKNLLLPRSSNSSSSNSMGAGSSSSNATSGSSTSTQQQQQQSVLHKNATAEAEPSGLQQWLPVMRGRSAAKKSQVDRFLVLLGPQCWDPNAVLQLNNTTRVPLKPQPLLDYTVGGVRNSIHSKESPWLPANQTGFEQCLAVRYKDYKWIGATGKVYRFLNGSHLEIPAAEVPQPEAAELAALLAAAARPWWESVAAEPNSFAKPTFYLGLNNWTATNMLAPGAHERSGNITLLALGAKGFVKVGERMCFRVQVLTAGQYEVIAMYTSNILAMFRLSVGPFASIQAGTAPSITSQLPPLSKLQGMSMGSLNLPVTPAGANTEACLELLVSSKPGTPVFRNLANLRFIRRPEAPSGSDCSNKSDLATSAGLPTAGTAAKQAVPAVKGFRMAVPAANPNAVPHHLSRKPLQESHMRAARSPVAAAAAAGVADGMSVADGTSAWEAVRQEYLLVDGQALFESVFSPYDTEQLERCDACQAALS